MANSIVSVRIPESMIIELKKSSKKNHFMDVSEAVRSIIRNNWIKQKDPAAYQLSRIRKEISDNITMKNQEELIEELKKIRDSILKNG